MARPDKRKGKRVWVIMDGPHMHDYLRFGPMNVYRLKRQAELERRVRKSDGWVGLTIRPATLVLDDPKRRGK